MLQKTVTKWSIIFLSLLFGFQTSASELIKCQLTLTQLETKRFPEIKEAINNRRERARKFIAEVNSSPFYSRIFIKNQMGPIEEKDFWGFFPKADPKSNRWLSGQFLPIYVTEKFFGTQREFHIFDGLITTANLGLKKIAESPSLVKTKLFEYFSDPTMAGLSVFLLESLAIGVFWEVFSRGMPYAVNFYIDGKVLEQYNEWGDVLRYDYRYHFIKRKLDRGELSQFDARKAAYLLNLAYGTYFDYMVKGYDRDSLDQRIEKLHDHILFSHVADFAELGVFTTPSYIALRPGPLSQKQKENLLLIHHRLYFGYQAVSEWIWSGGYSDLRGVSPQEKIILQNILSKKFAQSLVSMRDENKLTNPQLLYFIQMDLDFQRLYDEEKELHILPFRMVNGEPTREFNTDTLEDLRKEISDKIGQGKSLP